MADYENREIPEGINVSPTHPLKEFALLLAGVSALAVSVVLVLSLLAGTLVRHVPFAQEKALAQSVGAQLPKTQKSAVDRQREHYLQALAERLSQAMALPGDMTITVHYSPDSTVNAMATLGGNIVIFQGLIDALPSENALSMVVAHEIAHVRHRHPIVATGRGFAVALALSSIAGVGDGLMQQWLAGMGMLPVLSFSRSQEETADADALQALLRLYGHVGGASAFFEYLTEKYPGQASPALFNTHPGHHERIARIREFEQTYPARDSETARLIELPAFMKTGALVY
jgi:beta-barrel assembly-enhancing protease